MKLWKHCANYTRIKTCKNLNENVAKDFALEKLQSNPSLSGCWFNKVDTGAYSKQERG